MSEFLPNTERVKSKASLRKHLRKSLRKVRNSIPPEQRAHSALQISQQLNSLPCVAAAKTIAGYLVNDGELDLSAFMQDAFTRAKDMHKEVTSSFDYSSTSLSASTAASALTSGPKSALTTMPTTFSLPVLHPVCKGHLLFLEYGPHTTLVKNKYNIDEPELACHNVVPTSTIDVILMPLVGFDSKGNRLGMGGGYYDRTLVFTQITRFTQKKPILIGIAHDEQEVETLPFEPWDIPVDIIVTPKRILSFSDIRPWS
ncbi:MULTISPECIES: 5-formyltetrahydrofolate cyclo-ligase [unclassified Alteromonas]|uniref:5-formyltetrahydrofolate cyclo-ligase n=1 Tax=unclassified Alteromonas TaxID=2614992 RepID=UPI0009DFDBCD|nr:MULTISPECIES: 5-formyltetrahydrofolate cyclo-ligase [unclassified Alteromonas]